MRKLVSGWCVVAFAGVLSVLLAAAGCGPSELAKAYTPFVASAGALLDKEAAFWAQVAERANDQGDARGVAAYRRQLESEALKHYDGLEAALLALRPGHERLDKARDEMVEFARGRREFVQLEIARIDLAPKIGALAAVQQSQAAMDAAREAYGASLGDEAPDHRMAEVTALRDRFLNGSYYKAVEGTGDLADAQAALQKSILPQIRSIRDDRYDADERSKAFRRFVVATEEFFQTLSQSLAVVVPAARSAKRSETVLRGVEFHRTQFQRLLAEAKRDL